ncbi:AAA family ATPase [Sinorhizobium meliloti]|uniref:AAA family ATPase n=1 Tax=Rhizobium meliloti TaxID=382 RepID=UPI00299CD8B2|nr:AAA family ATPase [Sinorhizobium meliloti]MDW9873351.1 AAA family ATPase [Sinorhizobium meliloti]MDW9885051.1 AAA family ATPase [Sinorhizobium meliloti]
MQLAKQTDELSPIDVRLALFRNGYHPVLARGKVSDVAGWRTPVKSAEEIERLTADNTAYANTGLLCGALVGVDIDTPDPETAAALLAMAEALPGADRALRRVGKAPKISLFFRATETRKKVETPEYIVRGHKCQIEIMQDGQQVVGFGIHPETQLPYTWIGPSPLDVPFADLPEITPETIAGFVAQAEAYFAAHGTPVREKKDTTPSERSGGDTFWRRVNTAALDDTDAWVPSLFSSAHKEAGTGAWRVTSRDLGRDLQEDLSIHREGIQDFGLEQPETPLSLVEKWGGAPSPKDAAFWLCERLGRDPQEFGWERRDIGARMTLGSLGRVPVAANDNEAVPAELRALSIFEWPVSRFVGEPPAVDYLVDGVIPLGVPGMVSAMGDTGKSFALLELHRRVAFGQGTFAPDVFGGRVTALGTSVMITSEDDAGEVHRRISALDAKAERFGPAGQKMIVVPLPSAGGARAFWRDDKKKGLIETDDFLRICDQLRTINDLRLVTFDPLASFAHLALNEDPAAGQFVCTSLSRLATETGATVLVAHHMRKTQKPIENLGDARDAIRGSTALVDGLRLAYAMWPADEARAKRVCKSLGQEYVANKVVLGGVVKANGPAKRMVSTLVRNEFGLLIDRTSGLGAAAPAQADLLGALIVAVEAAAASGHPFTRTGATGLYAMRDRLPVELREVSRHRLEGLAATAIESGRIQLCLATGTTAKWLDVPGGPFAIGLGEFRKGAAR